MGGFSIKCPKCDKWFLSRRAVHDHVHDKHGEPLGFKVMGVGPVSRIERVYEKGKYQYWYTEAGTISQEAFDMLCESNRSKP